MVGLLKKQTIETKIVLKKCNNIRKNVVKKVEKNEKCVIEKK